MTSIKETDPNRKATSSLRLVAVRAGVSVATASAVLNAPQASVRVSAHTRERVLTAAAAEHYVPNAMARGLQRQRSNTLGVLFSWAGTGTLHHQFAVSMLEGVMDGAAASKYHVLLYTEPWQNPTVSATAFADGRTDGIIVVAPLEGSDVVSGLKALGLTVAVFSAVTEVPGVPFVHIDNQAGTVLALDHLRRLGHTRIAHLCHRRERFAMRERHNAYRTWMVRQGLPIPDAYVLADLPASGSEVTAARLNRLLRLPTSERPTAVFAANDEIAIEVLEAAQVAGLTVPSELSVVGFDDLAVAALTMPKLTTVRQPFAEMGKQTTQLLVEQIESNRARKSPSDERMAHIIQPELVVRASTAPPPSPQVSLEQNKKETHCLPK